MLIATLPLSPFGGLEQKAQAARLGLVTLLSWNGHERHLVMFKLPLVRGDPAEIVGDADAQDDECVCCGACGRGAVARRWAIDSPGTRSVSWVARRS
jgi:hypothetical protein